MRSSSAILFKFNIIQQFSKCLSKIPSFTGILQQPKLSLKLFVPNYPWLFNIMNSNHVTFVFETIRINKIVYLQLEDFFV